MSKEFWQDLFAVLIFAIFMYLLLLMHGCGGDSSFNCTRSTEREGVWVVTEQCYDCHDGSQFLPVARPMR